MTASNAPEIPSAHEQDAQPAAASLDLLFDQFEERYRRETSEVRTFSVQMHEIVGVTETVLDELSNRPLWKRVWQRLIGYTYHLQMRNFKNQLRLQQTNLLLTAAIVRQNRMIVEGLRLTLDKLQRIEQDAQSLRQTIMRMDERQERSRLRWQRAAAAVKHQWERVKSWFSPAR